MSVYQQVQTGYLKFRRMRKIDTEINRIRQIENTTDRSLELMLSVMRGQYFEDGNKRTAQPVANHEI